MGRAWVVLDDSCIGQGDLILGKYVLPKQHDSKQAKRLKRFERSSWLNWK